MADARTHTRSELAAFLSSSVGEAVSEAVIMKVAARKRMSPDRFTTAQALEIFEEASLEPGLVGIVARFAKSRLILSTTR